MTASQPVVEKSSNHENLNQEPKDRVINPEIIDQLADRCFWDSFAPEFTIEGTPDTIPFDVPEPDITYEKLIKEGYVHLKKPGIHIPLDETRALFTKLVDNGLPPVFAFAYDELWAVSRQLKTLISLSMHEDYVQLPDFWAWRVAPGQSGWTPHRDKIKGSLFPDKTPKCVTVWIPLTIAHPLNGCMYVLPADRDRLYGIDQSARFAATLPDIRALPGEESDVFLWTQHVLHWGAHSADDHDLPPRMSIAFEFQRRDCDAFNRPLLDPHPIPSFEQRMALIGKQILQYTHMYAFTDELVNVAKTFRKLYDLPPAVA